LTPPFSILLQLWCLRNPSYLNLEIIPIQKGCSLFDFIARYCKGESSGQSPTRAFHRLCSLMRKMDAKTVVVEKIDKNFSEIKDECNALSKYYAKNINFDSYKFTFILDDVKLEDILNLTSSKFLASAIVINFEKAEDPIDKKKDLGWSSYLYSAFVTIPKIKGETPLLNNYVHIFKTFQRQVATGENTSPKDFEITGTFFAEQNTITSVCAHASLCMILNNIESTADKLFSPEDINCIVGIDHSDRDRLAQNGLYDKDISKVLTDLGLDFKLLDFFSTPNIDYDFQIYHYLESKFPCLLVFTTEKGAHIVPILGHTLNSDIWKPEAERAYSIESTFDVYFSAVKWVDHFIIHDDNFGMYICLPVDTLKRITLPKQDPYYRAAYAVAIVPSDVKTTPREAEWASIFVTRDILDWREKNGSPLDKWCKRLLDFNLVTIRTFNVTRANYLSSLENMDFDGNSYTEDEKKVLTADLPDRFWLSELTLPDLYAANKHKIIDFFYGSNYPDDIKEPEDKKMNERWIQIRFPYVLVKRQPEGKLSAHPLSIKSHYPLFPHSSVENKQEW
jgi:hypothetical protein